MKKIFSLFAILALISCLLIIIGRAATQANIPAPPMQITLSSPSSEWIVGEPGFLEITWENRGNANLTLAQGLWYPSNPWAHFKITGPASRDCVSITRPQVHLTPFPHDDLKPAEQRRWNIRLSDIGITDVGTYDIWMEYDTMGLDSTWEPIHPFRGKIVSNHVKVKLVLPGGIDATALDDLADSCKRMPAAGGVNWKKVLTQYADSIYAAWMISSVMGAPEQLPPAKLKELIDKGFYPSPTSVPDPDSPNGWRDLNSKEMSQWIIEWSDRIVQHHSNFLYAKRVRLNFALNTLALGQRDKALASLKDIAQEQETPEGKWAKDFVALTK